MTGHSVFGVSKMAWTRAISFEKSMVSPLHLNETLRAWLIDQIFQIIRHKRGQSERLNILGQSTSKDVDNSLVGLRAGRRGNCDVLGTIHAAKLLG